MVCSETWGCMHARAPACSTAPDAALQVAVVTGANTGIGWEVAKELATHGARVLLCGRKPEKVAEAVKRLKSCRPTCTVEGYVVDLGSFRRAVARFGALAHARTALRHSRPF